MKSIILLSITMLCHSTSVNAQEFFTSKKIDYPGSTSSLLITHKNRFESGGFSALWVSPDCKSLLTISDYSQVAPKYLEGPIKRSSWFKTNINYNAVGELESLSIIDHGQLRNIDGDVMQGAAESIEWDGNGFLVSFDDRGDIYHYAGSQPESRLLNKNPTVAIKQKNLGKDNDGLESITVLAENKIFALWQRLSTKSKKAQGLIIDQSKDSIPFTYFAEADPGGATTLKDGSVLVLERDFIQKTYRLVRLVPENINHDKGLVKGELLLEENSGTTTFDNFEGISSCHRNGKEWAFVISDNNGDWTEYWVKKNNIGRQRTILLMIDISQLMTVVKAE